MMAAAIAEDAQYLGRGLMNLGDVADQYVQMSVSNNDADQHALGRMFGQGTAIAALAVAPFAKGTPSASAAMDLRLSPRGLGGAGEFSIIDWTGYPSGAPRPSAPFRVLQGVEYGAARSAANTANRGLHRADPSLAGLQLHEIKPVKFGGSPTDISNKAPLTPARAPHNSRDGGTNCSVASNPDESMDQRLTELAGQLHRVTGASEAAIEQFTSRYSTGLPEDYLQFMRWTNGAEGPVGWVSSVSLWPLEGIGQLNDDYGVSAFAPGLLIVGSDGGGIAYAFDLRDPYGQPRVVELPFIGMSLETSELRGHTLKDLFEYLAAQR